jgi:tRNA threonylcarbamoyl adenosine modification protein (Sua5/YciO/YrdC/YwlC family)
MLLSIPPIDPEDHRILRAVRVLEEGGVVVCPTDTVYAFVCDSLKTRAIERIARLKGTRPQKAELSLICHDLGQLSRYARALDTPSFRIMKRALPGPFTFILPAGNDIPKLFKTNRRTVGIRVPSHEVPLALARKLGRALVAASVHDIDRPEDHTPDPERIHQQFSSRVDLVIDAGPGGLTGSTVIDLSDGAPIVLREGVGSVQGLW